MKDVSPNKAALPDISQHCTNVGRDVFTSSFYTDSTLMLSLW